MRNTKPPEPRQLPQHLLPIKDRSLTGAACTGNQIFDHTRRGETKEEREYRHFKARYVCAHCVVRDACKTIADSLKGSERTGIWAGQLLDKE